MKPEPLKDKIMTAKFINPEIIVAERGDIKSAVEWLKEELCKRIEPYRRNGMISVINEAFEDVMKK